MTKINRKIEYSLMALKFMLGKLPGQLTQVKEVCECTGAPFDATSRVMQLMSHKGILKSEQGAHGGYQIVKDLSKVSFYELCGVVLGPVNIVKCVNSENPCDLYETCNIKSPLFNLNQKITEFYKTVTVLELLKTESNKPGVFESKSMDLDKAVELWT